jgi:hypothetical protein
MERKAGKKGGEEVYFAYADADKARRSWMIP